MTIGSRSQGTILILVLWILALLAFMVGDYLAYSRERAMVGTSSWITERENQAIESVVELFSSNTSPISGTEEEREWVRVSPGGVEVWVKVEKEEGRLNLNSATDPEIREKVFEIMANGDQDKAELIAEAILDWRDKDDLTRLGGAESNYYERQGLSYVPGNGPFQALTELLLVRGMSPELFWGDQAASIPKDKKEGEEEETGNESLSFSEAFTIFGENVKRLTILIPSSGDAYKLVLAFMKNRGNRWQVFQVYRTMLVGNEKVEKSEG